jgi:oligopeptide/dipeptide ABC transporter ATP-binding protein
MYCGRVVEQADVNTIFSRPLHPYTKGLIESIPSFDSTTGRTKERLKTIEGMVPSMFALPPGCSFQDRCAYATDHCRGPRKNPPLEELEPGHFVACFNPLI